jgi:hypothetical protein
MKYVFLFSLFLIPCLVFSAPKSPEEIEKELNRARQDFQTAEEMFIPWYTGPLITGSADNLPKGKINIQEYVFFDWQFGEFNNQRSPQGIATITTINPVILLQGGITTWLDFTLNTQGVFRWQKNNSAQEFGDINLTFGLQLLKENPYRPSVRFTIGESFPTGKYERLNANKNGIDASGSGAFETVIGLNISKIFWQMPLHPVRVRFSSSYAIANHDVHVEDSHAYGGGFGTSGVIDVGQTLNFNLGVEVSITQQWVFATDIAYTYSQESTFSGKEGLDMSGIQAENGAPSSDQLSVAPAIEYNFSDTGGFIGGIWFPITGRNSGNFFALILSYTQLF